MTKRALVSAHLPWHRREFQAPGQVRWFILAALGIAILALHRGQ